MPASQLPSLSGADKVFHAVEFCIFGMALGLAFVPGRSGYYIKITVVGICYAVLDEAHQHFVPGRAVELLDVLADSVGVMVSVAAARGWHRRRARRTAKTDADGGGTER